jgi:hypothetical protein
VKSRRFRIIAANVLAILSVVVSMAAPIATEVATAARAGSPACPVGPVFFGRAECIGYFSGRDVYVNGVGVEIDNVIDNGNASLMNVTNVNNFVSTMRALLYGSNYNDSFGAAFIIDTMLNRQGSSFGGSRNTGIAYAKSNFATWEDRVRYYDAQGRVNWNQLIAFNAPFQNSGRSLRVISDDIFYRKQTDETQRTIVFTNPNGTKFEIKKNCGNLVGTPTPLVPPPAYNLDPDINVSINNGATEGDVAQVGDSIRFTYQVENAASVNSDGTTTCTIYGGTYTGYHPIPDPEDTTSNGGYVPPGTGCPRVFNRNSTTTLATETITATTANRTICRTLVINPYAFGKGPKAIEVCVMVAAQPYVKVFGGDVSVGNGMESNGCTPNNTAALNSWNKGGPGFVGAGSQFATMALDTIKDFGSAQGAITGNIAGRADNLAFANTLGDVFGGQFGSLPCIPDYFAQANNPEIVGNTVNLSPYTDRTRALQVNGNATISGNVNPGNRFILYVDGDAYINGNITFPGNWSYDRTPMFQIIAKGNIYIDKSVTRIDGAFIAQQTNAGTKGNIYTCATSTGPYTNTQLYSNCATQLRINGLFSASQVYLGRTANSISDSVAGETVAGSRAAEVFNYNPAMWIAQPRPGTTTSNSKVGNYDAITSLAPVL